MDIKIIYTTIHYFFCLYLSYSRNYSENDKKMHKNITKQKQEYQEMLD